MKTRADLRPKTQQTYRSILELFRQSLRPGLPLSAVEEKHVAAFLDGRQIGDRSRQTYTTHLKAFFRWASAEGIYSDALPTGKKTRKARQASLPKFLSEAEYGRLLAAIDADGVLTGTAAAAAAIGRAVRFAAGTGLRLGEVCSLHWSAISRETGFVTVANTEDFQTKSGSARSVYLAGDARRVIDDLHELRTSEADDYVFLRPDGQPLGTEYLSKRFA